MGVGCFRVGKKKIMLGTVSYLSLCFLGDDWQRNIIFQTFPKMNMVHTRKLGLRPKDQVSICARFQDRG
jgi:hypothetical protein